MKKENKSNRRKFLQQGLLALAVPLSISSKAEENEATVKMLSSDGKLVEVSAKVLRQARCTKANNQDIQQWISKK